MTSTVPIDSLRLLNSETQTADPKALAAFIHVMRITGVRRLVLVLKGSNQILDGALYWQACKELGHKTIDVVYTNSTEQLPSSSTPEEQGLPELGHDNGWAIDFLPKTLPKHWVCRGQFENGGRYYQTQKKLGVIMTGAVELDDKRWLHVSLSYSTKLPGWEDMSLVHSLFLPNRYAYQVLAPATKHVNLHNYCLHLWSCLDEEPLPDFTRASKFL